jgi:hypothetical protein
MARDLAMERPTVTVGPVHHRGYTYYPLVFIGFFISHFNYVQ